MYITTLKITLQNYFQDLFLIQPSQITTTGNQRKSNPNFQKYPNLIIVASKWIKALMNRYIILMKLEENGKVHNIL